MKKNLKYICFLIINLLIIGTPSIIKADGVTLNKSEVTIGIGITETLKYTIKDGVNSSNILWRSSNPNVAIVQNGRVTGISEGSAIISATIGNRNSTCKVIVTSNYVSVTGITLNKSKIELLVGNSETLIKTVKPHNATNKDVVWKSSNPSVATVENGKVTAKKVGETKYLVTSDGALMGCIFCILARKPAGREPLENATLANLAVFTGNLSE